MAKKKAKNVEVTIETEKVNVIVEKKNDNVNVAVDTPNVDVTYVKEDDKKEFILDSRKLDVSVKKEGEVVTTEVEAKTGFLKQIGKVLSRIFLKRFSK